MTLSQQEFQKLEGLIKEKQNPDLSGFSKGGVSFASDADSDVRQIGTDISSSFNRRIDNNSTSFQANQNIASKTLQALGSGFGLVSDVGGSVLKGGVKAVLPQGGEDAVKNTIQSVAEPIVNSRPVQSLMERYNALEPEAKRNLDATLNIGALLAEAFGVGASAKVGVKTIATVGGKTLSTTGKVIEGTGKVVKGAGEVIYKDAITPTVAEAERILKYKAESSFIERLTGKGNKPVTRADTAFEKGLKGTQTQIGVQARRESSNLYKTKIAPALDNSTDVITKDELFSSARELVSTTKEPGKKKALQTALEALEDDYKDVVDYSLKDAQEIKRGLDEFQPDKVFRGQPIANEYKTLQKKLADSIRQKTYVSLKDVNIRKAYLDYGNLKQLEKVGVKAISESGFKAGFGGFWSTAWDMATTPIKTIGGRTLYRVGDKLEFTGESGIKKFGDYLQSKGFKKPTKSFNKGDVPTTK